MSRGIIVSQTGCHVAAARCSCLMHIVRRVCCNGLLVCTLCLCVVASKAPTCPAHAPSRTTQTAPQRFEQWHSVQSLNTAVCAAAARCDTCCCCCCQLAFAPAVLVVAHSPRPGGRLCLPALPGHPHLGAAPRQCLPAVPGAAAPVCVCHLLHRHLVHHGKVSVGWVCHRVT